MPSGLKMVRGTFDHQCLIYRHPEGDIRAFVSLRQITATEARIGLLAGRGAGAQLMQAARYWAASRGLSTLRVATQMGNTAALKRYILSGANVESTAYWLQVTPMIHLTRRRWLEPSLITCSLR